MGFGFGLLESTPLFYIVWSLITRKRLLLLVYVHKETSRLRENEYKSKVLRNFLKAMKRYRLPNSKRFWIARDRKWKDRKLTKSLTHGTNMQPKHKSLFSSKLKRKKSLEKKIKIKKQNNNRSFRRSRKALIRKKKPNKNNKKHIDASVKERPQTLLVTSEEIFKLVLCNKHI